MDPSKLFENCPYIYYINLNRSLDRKEEIEKNFNQLNLKYERIEAVDGNNLQKWDNRLSKYEHACTLSHLKAIEKFYNSENEIAIICEDDITLEFLPHWKTSLFNVYKNAPSDWEILMVSYIVWPVNHKYLEQLYNPFVACVHSGTGSYIINKKSAKKILEKHNLNNPRLENFTKIRPVADVIIYELVKTYVYKYSLFTFSDENVSTIHNVNPNQTDEERMKEAKELAAKQPQSHPTKQLAKYIMLFK
jgi:GR25 family glycosyltransferase involved in LPS biosynthesis